MSPITDGWWHALWQQARPWLEAMDGEAGAGASEDETVDRRLTRLEARLDRLEADHERGTEALPRIARAPDHVPG